MSSVIVKTDGPQCAICAALDVLKEHPDEALVAMFYSGLTITNDTLTVLCLTHGEMLAALGIDILPEGELPEGFEATPLKPEDKPS
jgi:hypothetical protein